MKHCSKEILIKKVTELRKKLKLTREELSLLLEFDNSYISKLEGGRINITLESLDKIAKFFNLETPKLLTQEKEDKKRTKEKIISQNKNLNLKLGKNIEKYRKRKKLSQNQMSALLNLSPSYVGKVEKGELNLTLDKIVLIANFFEIEVISLFK